MQFIQLTDEAGREVWVNLEAVEQVRPFVYEASMSQLTRAGQLSIPDRTGLEITLQSGDVPILIIDPAEINRLNGILSLIAGDPAANVRHWALKPARVEEE